MSASRTTIRPVLHHVALAFSTLIAGLALLCLQARADASAFIGTYSGSAEVVALDGSLIPRDMSVEISETKDGFRVQWTSVTYRGDGSVREKSYEIDFVDSDRDAVFAAAQRKNVFGHVVQLDPMKGEPYVWARIVDETLTVYSLFVGADGGYSLQQYDRTLADGGLNLRFQTIRDGEIQRAVETFLARD
ncbi:MAG: hypothetical protein ABJ263_07080 [Tateyamaria sp.]|uniref:hypothetical protein n=1 Tax=Tateyamaria sp. TaxID=1929288 RepID=UPI003278FF66